MQELEGRLRLGIGVGWMAAEFRAVGVDRARRGAITDETLAFLQRCFAADEVEAHGQPFLFRPRPPRPPIFVGGAPPHALVRAARFGDGWMPMGADPEVLRAPIAELHRLAAEYGRPKPEVVVMGRLRLDERDPAAEQLAELSRIGVTRFVLAERYADADAFKALAGKLAALA